MQFFAVYYGNKILPAMDGKNNLDVDLRIGVWHSC